MAACQSRLDSQQFLYLRVQILSAVVDAKNLNLLFSDREQNGCAAFEPHGAQTGEMRRDSCSPVWKRYQRRACFFYPPNVICGDSGTGLFCNIVIQRDEVFPGSWPETDLIDLQRADSRMASR